MNHSQLCKDISDVINRRVDCSSLLSYVQSPITPEHIKIALCEIILRRRFKYLHNAKFYTRDRKKFEREVYACTSYPDELYVKLSPFQYVRMTEYLCDIGLMRCAHPA